MDQLQPLRTVGQLDVTDLESIPEDVEDMIRKKWDWALPRPLLTRSHASSQLDLEGAIRIARKITRPSRTKALWSIRPKTEKKPL